MRVIFISLLSIFLTCCEKEPEPVFTTVRRIMQVEGVYEGTISLNCDSIGMHKTYTTTVMVTAFSSEMLSIKNNLFVGSAYPSVQGSYHYIQADWIDITDCGKLASYSFCGTGKLEGDQLVENGIFVMHCSGKKYLGKWETKSTKVK